MSDTVATTDHFMEGSGQSYMTTDSTKNDTTELIITSTIGYKWEENHTENSQFSTMENAFIPTGAAAHHVPAAVIIILVILLLSVAIGAVLGYRSEKLRRQRRNSPFHMPIIEYKDDNISVSTFSSAGYGTYTELEDGYSSLDIPSKIDGHLRIGLCGGKRAVEVTT